MRVLPDLPALDLGELMFTGDIRHLEGDLYLVMGVTALYTVSAADGRCNCVWALMNPDRICKHSRWLATWLKEETSDP